MKRAFFALIALLAFFACVLRFNAVAGNNLIFTVDQGRDALYAREILSGHLNLKGPETNIRGIYAGPLLDYVIAGGFALFGGHPFGAAFVMIAINLSAVLVLTLWLSKRIPVFWALAIGFLLQIFWPFFETTLWGFHPFVLVAIGIFLMMFMLRLLEGAGKFFYYGLFLIFLALNVEVAGALALYLFFLAVSGYCVKKKIIKLKNYLVLGIFSPLTTAVILAKDFLLTAFSQKVLGAATVLPQGNSGAKSLGAGDVLGVAWEFVKIIGSVIPQNYTVGVLVFALTLYLFWVYRKRAEKTTTGWVYLALVLTFISFVFFSATSGWRSWHTVYLPPIIFIGFILALSQIPKKFSVLILLPVLACQILYFKARYEDYQKDSRDPSILYNQLFIIDWIYGTADNLGFRVYTYTDTFHDYTYQYLFPWYALPKYGYLPEEYANYPLSPKELYVPGYARYSSPYRSGEETAYIIYESNTNGESNKDWPETFKKYFDRLETLNFGEMKVSRYRRKKGAPNDQCIWWGNCEVLPK